MSADNILIIFIKYPQCGFVKTRLAKKIGTLHATHLYRIFVETILKRTEDKFFKRIIFYTPQSKKEELRSWIGKNLEFYPQKGNILGDRVSRAFGVAFKKKAKKVIVIGTDAPLLDNQIIKKAFRKLNNRQCVIGPCFDGGYYLIGLSFPCREIFQNISWSTGKVFKQTLKKIKKIKLKYYIFSPELDVDDFNDLAVLHQRLKKMSKNKKYGLNAINKFLQKIISCAYIK